MNVKDVMTNKIYAALPNASIAEVAKKMKELNVGSIPVCNQQNQPLGIITDRDIVLRCVAQNSKDNATASEVMSKGIVSVTPDTHIHEAARIMGENQVRRLPVIENGKMVGMVSIGDLAVRNDYENEAGEALSNISTPSRPMM
ncbi:CBS domain-containing protein [Alkaliphilus oremlandii]|uniref:Putative signal-transduction protein with CBS domains n=1 Tax=Alkaliphilus oremlandii (strain OhILAs) TaxID=350688 RepID=A8MIB5_ALKOO|nr:CBS domain-containing protein [Alkaliphilus oremlandii]ABW19547.1 putative signal-transduction protein with CBS domains [Alkaliphilus oremlandii OhILAs]